MQPRWHSDWNKDTTYLGGTNDVDLWIDPEGGLLVVCGPGIDDWDYWVVAGDVVTRKSYDSGLTDDQIAEAFLYLDLFVPDLKERLQTRQAAYRAITS